MHQQGRVSEEQTKAVGDVYLIHERIFMLLEKNQFGLIRTGIAPPCLL